MLGLLFFVFILFVFVL